MAELDLQTIRGDEVRLLRERIDQLESVMRMAIITVGALRSVIWATVQPNVSVDITGAVDDCLRYLQEDLDGTSPPRFKSGVCAVEPLKNPGGEQPQGDSKG